MNKQKFMKEYYDRGIFQLPEGVSIENFIHNVKASEESIESLRNALVDHHYDIRIVPGAFYRLLSDDNAIAKTVGKPERKGNLDVIEEMGLHDVVQASMRYECFTESFTNRVAQNLFPVVLEDGTINPVLFDGLSFELEKMKNTEKPMEETPVEVPTEEKKEETLTDEEIEKLQEVQAIVHEMIMSNPENTYIPLVAKNILTKVIPKIRSKEYEFFGMSDMISGCMFDGLDVTPADQYEVEEALKRAVENLNEENKKVVGGR